ncbi:Afadin and alpha-actinin-binding-domain-containing protein [Xylaria intraflava]|nr:Afadin and alpha-actinin-binding-domain-containing protein [Xylaria intraflava]
MIDPENLRTASLYINNQLLSRGLLRDGQNIDFADPEGSDGGLQTAMGRIISVVNDLILRRDRDAEHRESLSSTLRTLRLDVQRQTTELTRQTEKLNDAQRRLDIAESTERALRTQLKTAEQGIHRLKDEMARLKSLVAQTRSACANEVRKRDRQIDSLKKAVTDAGRVRGGGKSRDVMSISVTGEVGGAGRDEMGMPVGATENEGYSLRMETNAFLTELAKGLSEENEGLLALVRRTVDGLREMSGLDRGAAVESHESLHGSHIHDEFVAYPPRKAAEELAAELEAIVEHLRSILTNPSFVPIEEVEDRDEVIKILRAGMETMESRWKDAVHLIDGWRRRMVSSGKSVDMEDLQMGLMLSPVPVRDVQETAHIVPPRLSCVHEEEAEEEEEEPVNTRKYNQQENDKPEPRHFRTKSPAESLRLVPAPGYEAEELGDESESDSSIFQEDLDIDDLDVEEPNVQILQISTAESIESSPLPEPPQISPLKDSYSSGNRGSSHKHAYRKRPEEYTAITEENTWDLAAAEKGPPVPRHASKPVSSRQRPPRASTPPPPVEEEDDALSSYTASYDSPLFGKSGERPSQAQLNRKLFSKPSASEQQQQRSKNTTSQPMAKEGSPPPRMTRSSARKSAENPPVATTTTQALKRTLSDPKNKPRESNASLHTGSTANSITTTTAVSTTSQQKQAPESGPRTSSTNASPEKLTRSSGRATTPGATTAASSSSRLPRPHAQQSPLNMATIAAKLAASEREADAARVRAKLKAVRRSRRISGVAEGARPPAQSPTPTPSKSHVQTRSQARAEAAAEEEGKGVYVEDGVPSHSVDEDMDPVKRVVRTVRSRPRAGGDDDVDELAVADDRDELDVPLEIGKRRRVRRASRVVSRRRSTLSPWELQGLIQGRVESPLR